MTKKWAIKKLMRGVICSGMILCLLLACMPHANAAAKAALEGFENISENDRLALFALREKGEVAVMDKTTGKVWYSNPQDKENDPLANGFNKQALYSQVLIRYGDARGVTMDMPSNLSVTMKKGLSNTVSDGAITFVYDFIKEKISIPVKYSIGEDCFKAEIITSGIKEYGVNTLTYVQLLPFFGAGGTADTGYILVPDGSGAIIRFNNGKTAAKEYEAPVYGDDAATGTKSVSASISYNTMLTKPEAVSLPMFGVKDNEDGFIAVITKSAPRAFIKAYVSGMSTSYNNAYTQFQFRETGSVRLVQREFSDVVSSISERVPETAENYEVSYYFLDHGRSSYADMAARYRKYLTDNENLTQRITTADIPFYIDLYGYVNKTKSFLGIPYEAAIPLTTFDDALKMVKTLNDASISNVTVKFNDWIKDGVYKKIPVNAVVSNKIGGDKGLELLKGVLSKNGGQLYLSADLMNVYQTGNGFNRYADALLSVANTPLLQVRHNLDSAALNANFGQWFLLSPDRFGKFYDLFLNNYIKLGLDSLALDSIGEMCYSDLSSRGTSRSAIPSIVRDTLSNASKVSPNLMLTGAFDYTASFASHVINTPLESSDYDVFDEDVPFWQIVFHGVLSYSLTAANLSSNPEQMALHCLETGAAPMYSWVGRNNNELINTRMNDLFSADYSLWMDDAVKNYKTVNAVLSKVCKEPITYHEKLADGVFATTYGSSTTVIVNYNDHPAEANGKTIEPNGFIVLEGND